MLLLRPSKKVAFGRLFWYNEAKKGGANNMLERNEDKRREVRFVALEGLVPRGHLLRKIEKVINFDKIYEMVEHLYSSDEFSPRNDS